MRRSNADWLTEGWSREGSNSGVHRERGKREKYHQRSKIWRLQKTLFIDFNTLLHFSSSYVKSSPLQVADGPTTAHAGVAHRPAVLHTLYSASTNKKHSAARRVVRDHPQTTFTLPSFKHKTSITKSLSSHHPQMAAPP